MSDPYEEEKVARKDAPIAAMLMMLDRARAELLQAREARDLAEHSRIYDGAMNLLYNVFNLSHPVAKVANGKKPGNYGFMWIAYADPEGPPTFHWLVCSSDGAWKTGQETTQEICEAAVDSTLRSTR